MQFLRKSWEQIRGLIAGVSPSLRMLLVALVVILLLVLAIILPYAAKPQMVPIGAFVPLDRHPEVMRRLQADGIKAETRNGEIWVSQSSRDDAMSRISQAGMMVPDASAAFDKLISQQNIFMTDRQNAQAFLNAKRQYLGVLIGRMQGVRSAEVNIDLPDDRGFGKSRLRPTASVLVTPDNSRRVDKALVDAVAGLIAGAVSGLKRDDVEIIDAAAGRRYTVKSDQDAMASDVLELVQQLEQYHRAKIEDVLKYIPHVIVAVNVQADPTRHKQIVTTEFEKSEPLRREKSSETDNRSSADAAAPGTRTNTGLDIEAAGSGTATAARSTTSETEFGAKQPVRTVSALEAGHTIQQINVTINVPRSYFVALHQRARGEAAGKDAPGKEAAAGKQPPAEPDDAALQPVVQQQLAQIQQQVEPLVAATGQGVVRAFMYPDTAGIPGSTAMAGAGGGAVGAVGSLLGADWVKTLALAGLVALSLGIMLGMVRKATQAAPLPTVAELAGVPPTLPAEDDLVGEADETAPSLAGVELDEEELRHRKIAEQISEMIRNNPTEAAQLVRRWVRTEE